MEAPSLHVIKVWERQAGDSLDLQVICSHAGLNPAVHKDDIRAMFCSTDTNFNVLNKGFANHLQVTRLDVLIKKQA